MKIEDFPLDIRDKCEFACKVCRAFYRAETGKKDDCSCRTILNEYCPYVEKVIEQERLLKPTDICVACGNGYAVEGSLLCPNCKSKIGGG